MTKLPDVTVRPARLEDAPALGRLAAQLVTLHHGYDAERFVAPGPQTEHGYGRFLASQIDKKDAVVLVAEAGGKVVGYAYAALEGPDWMALRGPAGVLHDILVAPDARGGHVGAALLDAVLAALAGLGAPRVVLHTAARNEAAQRFFTTAGFRPTMVEMTREGMG